VAGAGDLGSAPEVVADALALPSDSRSYEDGRDIMHNQHVGLTGVLAEQRMTERREQADQQRLRSARPPRRRRQRVRRRWWQLARWPVGA
jgi:hypothetical protein